MRTLIIILLSLAVNQQTRLILSAMHLNAALFAVAATFCAAANADKVPAEINVAIVSPMTRSSGKCDERIPSCWHVGGGIDATKGALMAIREINDKSDGIFDNLLPGTNLTFTVRNTAFNKVTTTLHGVDMSGYSSCSSVNSPMSSVVIGTGSSGISKTLAPMLQTFGIPQVSFAASSPDLSDQAVYPYFTRTCYSDAQQSSIMAQFIKLKLGFEHANVLTSDGGYSSAGGAAFIEAAKKHNITIPTSQQYIEDGNSEDLEKKLQVLKNTGVKLIVAYFETKNLYAPLIAARKLGMWGSDGFTWILSESVCNYPDRIKTGLLDKCNEEKWQGYFESSSGDCGDGQALLDDALRGAWSQKATNGPDEPAHVAFNQRWSTEKDFGEKANGCSAEKDATGYYVWQQNWNDPGASTDKLATNESETNCFEIVDHATAGPGYYAPFAYDAVVLSAAIFNDIIERGGELTAANFMDVLNREDFVVNGALTGSLIYSDKERTGGALWHMYGRVKGKESFQKVYTTKGQGSFSPILESAQGLLEGQIEWANGATKDISHEKPLSILTVPAEDRNLLPSGIRGFGTALMLTNIVLALLCIAWTIVKMDNMLVRMSQPHFLILIATGCILSSLTIHFFGIEDSLTDSSAASSACMLSIAFYSIGFCISYGALAVKLYKVYRLYENSKRMRFVRITLPTMLMWIAAIIIVDGAILLIWSSSDPLRYERAILSRDLFDNPTSSVGSCKSEDTFAYLGLLIGIHVALLTYGCWLAYKAAGMGSLFAETKYIAIAMFSNFQIFAISIPILFIAADDAKTNYFVRTGAVFLNDLTTLLVIFLPKILDLHMNLNIHDSAVMSKALSSAYTVSDAKSDKAATSDLSSA